MASINTNNRIGPQYVRAFHPAENVRIARELHGLKRSSGPFGANTRSISINAQITIINYLTRRAGLPHPRFLTKDEFQNIRMPGWKKGLWGMYTFYQGLRQRKCDGSVQIMMDRLGVPRLKDLPVEEQMDMVFQLKQKGKQIDLSLFGCGLVKRLIEEIAEAESLPHERAVTGEHLRKTVIPGVGMTLTALYENFARNSDASQGEASDKILDQFGIEPFEALPFEAQKAVIAAQKDTRWDFIPDPTQLKLLELLKSRAKNYSGMQCPHLRALNFDNMREEIPEIKKSLVRLMWRHRDKKPKGYAGTDIDHMLDRLGVPSMKELDFETQCKCKAYNESLPWVNLPANMVVRLLEIVRKKAEIKDGVKLPHLRSLRSAHFTGIVIEEIGSTLGGLYNDFYLRKLEHNDKRDPVDLILDHYGVERLDQAPFSLQLEVARSGKLTRWGRMPEEVIKHYLHSLSIKTGTASPLELSWSAMGKQRIGGRESSLHGMFNYLSKTFGLPRSGMLFKDAPEEFMRTFFDQGVSESIAEKRLRGGQLTNEENDFLVKRAKLGDNIALENLLYFYERLIMKCVHMAKAKYPFIGSLPFNELKQIGDIRFVSLIGSIDIKRSKIITYVYNYLPFHIIREAIESIDIIRRPVYYIQKEEEVARSMYRLAKELGRSPTDEEIAEDIRIKTEEVAEIRQRRGDVVSLESTVPGTEELTLIDVVPQSTVKRPDEDVFGNEYYDVIEKAIERSGLTADEKYILRERLKERTFADIGRDLDVTDSRVQQIEKKALKKLGRGPYRKALRDLFED